MAELKKHDPVSAWVEYELDTKQMAPPVLRLRLKYLNDAAALFGAGVDAGERFEKVLDLVTDWDVTYEGQPVPLTEKIGRDQLTSFVTRRVVGRDILLGLAIIQDAQDRELFVKN